jgi:hypothetical protein
VPDDRPGVNARCVIGGLLILSGATFPLWMLFGEASLSAHIILSVVGILTMLGSMAFSAAAFRSWFRLYWLISLAAGRNVLRSGTVGRAGGECRGANTFHWPL